MGESGLVGHIERGACRLPRLCIELRIVIYNTLLLALHGYSFFRLRFPGGGGGFYLSRQFGGTITWTESLRLTQTSVIADKTAIRCTVCYATFWARAGLSSTGGISLHVKKYTYRKKENFHFHICIHDWRHHTQGISPRPLTFLPDKM